MSNDLDQALAAATDVQDAEDSYGLSPTQEGMLLYTLREPRAALFFQQMVLRLRDPDPASFVKAWQLVVDRHPILRSSFHWEGFSRPVQTVHRSVELPVAHLDWRDLPPFEQEQRLSRFLDEDRQRGFDLNRAPLLRLALMQVGEADYICVKSHHHLVLDGWSGTIVLKEVQQLHRALQRGRGEVALPEPRPYRHYIEWLGRQDLKAAEAFWRERLAGFMAPTPLPGERSTGARTRPAARFLSHRVTLSPESTSALQHLSQRWRITLSTAVQGAWALLLGLWSGEEDVVFGATVSGRPADLEGVEAMVGLFINALPVRVQVRPQQSVEGWLGELHARQRQLQQYEYSPPAQVQSWSEVPRGVPIFETLVTYNSESMSSGTAWGGKAPAPGDDEQRSGGRRGRREPSRPDPTNQALSLVVVEARGQLQMDLTADAHRFEAGTLIRLLEQLRVLLEGFTAAQQRKVGELSLATPAELHQVIQGWNETEVEYPRQGCLHHLFEATVRRSPDKTAVLFDGQTLSYAELNRRANRLAHYLRSQGVGPEVTVGLAVERSPEMVVGLLAILKAGGAYVPLDPGYPSARLALIMGDSQATLLLTEEKLAEAWRACPVPVVLLDRDQDRWRDQPVGNPDPDVYPENLAFMVYTSGSTGTPKGVGVPHRVCVNRMYVESDPLRAGEVLCAKTSISFIDSVWELFLAWTHGLPTLLVQDQVRDPVLLVEAMAEAGVTRLVLVPSLLQALLDCGQPLSERLPRLQHWISSGEPLPHDVSRRFAHQLPDRVLTNLYGTSETWDSTRCDSRQNRPEDGLPIGRPMGNCRVYVLDRRLRPVPVGVPGELFVGGVGLARGYHRRADLTAERFLPDPFSHHPSARLYRTGDRVRWQADGQLEFLGRIGQQLKVRGFRIEPGEVEAVLRGHPDVHQAVVGVTPRQQLAAYIQPVEGRTPPTGELRELSRQRLPAFMVPDLFLRMERLPLTPSGKIDRRALPAPEADRQDRARPYRPPATATESAVATVWAEILDVTRVGIEDNFFELGGHSLLATQAISRLSSAVGVKVPLHALFDAPTVAGLARWIDLNRDNPDTEAGPPILAAEQGAEEQRQAPQSFAQQRLWFLSQLAPGSSLYNTMTVIRLPGALDLDALERTLTELVRRHEALRTTFGSKDGAPIQLVAPPAPVRLPVSDLRPLPGDRRQGALQQLRRMELTQPFDLARGPLVRFQLVRLEDRSQVLILAMHHIVTDGWSMGVLRREIHALYEAFRAGEPSPLPEPALQYADFAIWQRRWLQGTVLQAQLDYWKEQLAGASPLELPTDRPRPAVPRYASARQRFRIDSRLTGKLRDLARQEDSTLFMTLLAAFQIVLSRYSGQGDVVVGTPIANRTRAELEYVVGFFVNTLVLRTKLAPAETFRQLLQQVRQTCLEAYSHQDLPFENLVEELAPRRDLSLQPLIQVLFVLQNTPQSAVEPHGQGPVPPVADMPEEAGLIYFDLTLSLTETASELSGSLHFNTDLFDPGTAQRLVGHFQTLLAAIADHPDQALSSVSMLPARERRQLLSTPGRRPAHLRERCIHQLVEDQVDRTPDRPAVTFEGRRLTYRELDRQANQLAHRLGALGVRPEVPVGLYVDRGVEAIVGLLGILKAGGVYVPLDPSLPRERLGWMLGDARPAVLLTQEALRPGLTERQEPVLCLDNPRSGLRREPGSRPGIDVRPGQLAYIIYTSGSTGRPKGVTVEHHSLSHTIGAQLPLFGVTEDSRVLATIALSFDASLGEIFRTLCAGAMLCLARREELLPGPSLIRLLREQRITMTSLVTPVLAALPVEEDLPELRTLTVGGEALPAELAARWSRGRRLLNGYGPTEATVGVTLARIEGREPSGKPPLGTPLPGVRAYVLDERMQLLPMGVPGELYLGGPGVARGYLGRPGLTAERFLPDPFGVEPGRRLYRTGDRVRWLTDGQLEFLGRVDEQVKVRGHRVEPGEVATVLGQHPRVREAAVVARDHSGQHRLVAYVVPSHDQRDLAKAADELVGEWRQASEVAAMSVEAAEVPDPRMNFAGWVSSYTGEPIPVDEMRQWADATVARIVRLGPREVLEIGSGTGLVMFRLAPHCRRYLGVDLSAGLLEQARRHLGLLNSSTCQVELRQGRADELDDLPDQSFDCVVLNSVVQYFPDVEYLLRVLDGAVRLVRRGGAVFLGDVRNLPLLDAFHTSVQLSKAAATLPASRLVQLARRRRSSERELVLHPGLFAQLARTWPRVSHLQVLLKPGAVDNELTRFRYDVVLHVEGQAVTELGDHWLAWEWESQEAGLRRLREILAKRPARLGVQRVPNARTAADTQLVSWLESRADLRSVAELRRELAHAGQGVQPDALTSLGRELGYDVELSWLNCDDQGRYDVLFRRGGGEVATAFPAPSGSRAWQEYANNPAEAAHARNLALELRDYLGERLPEYMVPSAFVTLEALPLTPHGKLDRRSLPAPEGEQERPGAGASYVAPRTPAEKVLAEIWADLLRLERVGVHDNFFELGGDSILSIRVISRANQAGLNLTTQDVYRLQTVAEQAAAAGDAQEVAADQDQVTGELPVTPIQHWFLEGAHPEPHHFNWATFLPAPPELSGRQLRRVLRTLLSHHDALRLRIVRGESGAWREFLAEAEAEDQVPLTIVDLSGLPPDNQRAVIEARAAELQTSLDFSEGPLLRLAWFVTGRGRPGLGVMGPARRAGVPQPRGRPGRLLLIVHHLAVDAISWPILLADLRTLLQQARTGQPMQLPAKSSSFKEWAECLERYAVSGVPASERRYWLDERRRNIRSLPRDHPGGVNSRASLQELSVALTEQETQALQGLARVMQLGVDEVMLAALGLGLARWTGTRRVLVNVERHGREDLGADLNLSRTVGWFANIAPMLLEVPGNAPPEEVTRALRDQVRAIPNRGVGYGLLRYVGDETVKAQLREQAEAEVFFNYFGQQWDSSEGRARDHGAPQPGIGPLQSPKGLRRHLIEINAMIQQGRLHMRWSFSANVHDRASIERLAQEFAAALEATLVGGRSLEQGTLEAEDFREVNLDLDHKEFAGLLHQLGAPNQEV